MPRLKLDFDLERPIVQVEVKPSVAYQQALKTGVPANIVPSISPWFLVDTGASGCCIDAGLILHGDCRP